jgi:hypothetical protein
MRLAYPNQRGYAKKSGSSEVLIHVLYICGVQAKSIALQNFHEIRMSLQ